MNENSMKRKLRAILSADVKGYSILMAHDEAATVNTLTAYRDLFSALTRKHHGRIVDTPGDNILAQFGSVVDSVRCAVEIQEELKARNLNLLDHRKMEFRIGIHVGDIIQERVRIYGYGVNVAARIEGLAEAGGICISRAAYDQVKDKLNLNFEYMGEHSVKNMEEPVRVYRVVTDPDSPKKVLPEKKKKRLKKFAWAAAIVFVLILGIAAVLFLQYYYLPDPVDIDPEGKMNFELPQGPSIAVLPFTNMTDDPDQEFFCDGITENLITFLSRVPRTFVIARNSTFAYKGKAIDIRQIGKELGVRYVLEGSVQKTGNRIRITAQLIDAESGSHLWSEKYDRELKDIFALQDEITLNIAMALGVKIGGEHVRAHGGEVRNIDIVLKSMEALTYIQRMNKEGNALARQKTKEIIAIDPDISDTYVIVGYSHLFDLWFGVSENPLISFAKATEAARNAVVLDEKNPDAHLLLGHIFIMRGEHEKAIAEVKQAISLNPNSAEAYTYLGYFLYLFDQPSKGIEFMKKAIRLNPFPPGHYLHQLGHAYRATGQYGKAIEAYQKSLGVEPNNIFANIGLAATYSMLDREKEAHKAALEVLRIDPDFSLKKYADILPMKNENQLKHYIDALRKTGLK